MPPTAIVEDTLAPPCVFARTNRAYASSMLLTLLLLDPTPKPALPLPLPLPPPPLLRDTAAFAPARGKRLSAAADPPRLRGVGGNTALRERLALLVLTDCDDDDDAAAAAAVIACARA